jgi:hypothetical protein
MAGEEVIKRLRNLHRQEKGKSDSSQSPLGSNNVKYNTWFYGHPVHGDQFMWCAVYQSWVASSAKIPTSIIPKNAAVRGMRDFFQAKGRIFQTPRVGDLVLMISADESRRHIGFVDLLLPDGRFESIEGNYEHRVSRVKHSPSEPDIIGYGRPEYHKVQGEEFDEVATKAEIQEAVREVVAQVVRDELTKQRKMLTDGGDGTGNVNKERNNLQDIRESVNKAKDDIRESVKTAKDDIISKLG